MSYIASNDSRLYAGLETSFGEAAPEGGRKRVPAVRFAARQKTEVPQRRDKTGTRSFRGVPDGARRTTSYELRTYLTSWTETASEPGYGPLFQAALGGTALIWAGGTLATSPTPTRIQFQGAHGLTSGQALVVGGEMRFVTAVVDATTVDVNAPFTVTPPAGAPATPTVTYKPAKKLQSATVLDFWAPSDAVQRILTGATVDEFGVSVNADYHEFDFKGPAADVIDSGTFTSGQGGLATFPEEPSDTSFDESVVPGHLGQVWMGTGPDRFYTLTAAKLRLKNNVDLRSREFGSGVPRAIVAGEREVTADFELFADDDAQTKALYEAARQGSAVPAMFQLGQQPGQLFGAYLKAIVPTMPDYDDGETRLSWKFNGCRAQGAGEDEIAVAFG